MPLKTAALILMVSLFFVHEMDAMTHSEWRLLPGLNLMEDGTARQVFVLLQIPIFFGVIWALFVAKWREKAAVTMCGLAVVHAIAHFLMSGHAQYAFSPPIETITVYGAAASAMVFLFLNWKSKTR